MITGALTDPAALLALAERVEKLAGPCRETDAEIRCAIGWDRDVATAWVRYDFTSSLDIAMGLVPEGYGWRLWVPASDRPKERPVVMLWGPLRTYAPNESDAATPALALTAAAIRARAQGSGHG